MGAKKLGKENMGNYRSHLHMSYRLIGLTGALTLSLGAISGTAAAALPLPGEPGKMNPVILPIGPCTPENTMFMDETTSDAESGGLALDYALGRHLEKFLQAAVDNHLPEVCLLPKSATPLVSGIEQTLAPLGVRQKVEENGQTYTKWRPVKLPTGTLKIHTAGLVFTPLGNLKTVKIPDGTHSISMNAKADSEQGAIFASVDKNSHITFEGNTQALLKKFKPSIFSGARDYPSIYGMSRLSPWGVENFMKQDKYLSGHFEVSAGELNLNNLTFRYGSLEETHLYGGSIWASGPDSSVNVNGCNFENNKAITGGSAIAALNGATVNINQSTFTHNFVNKKYEDGSRVDSQVESVGGALAASSTDNAKTTVSVNNSQFIENKTQEAGAGAIGIWQDSDSHKVSVDVHNTTFVNNKSGDKGGAILVDRGNLSVHDSQFSKNLAANAGGAIATINNGTVTLGDDHSPYTPRSVFKNNCSGTLESAGCTENHKGNDIYGDEVSAVSLAHTNFPQPLNGHVEKLPNPGEAVYGTNVTLGNGVSLGRTLRLSPSGQVTVTSDVDTEHPALLDVTEIPDGKNLGTVTKGDAKSVIVPSQLFHVFDAEQPELPVISVDRAGVPEINRNGLEVVVADNDGNLQLGKCLQEVHFVGSSGVDISQKECLTDPDETVGDLAAKYWFGTLKDGSRPGWLFPFYGKKPDDLNLANRASDTAEKLSKKWADYQSEQRVATPQAELTIPLVFHFLDEDTTHHDAGTQGDDLPKPTSQNPPAQPLPPTVIPTLPPPAVVPSNPAPHTDFSCRIGGVGRVETSLEIWKRLQSKTMILVGYEHEIDALAATPLATYLKTGIVYTQTDRLNPLVGSALQGAGVEKVVIVGGTGAVSSAVESSIQKLGIATERLGGADRFLTSLYLASHELQLRGADKLPIFLADGLLFADATVAGPVAAVNNGLLLLVNQKGARKEITDFVAVHGAGLAAIGGPSARAALKSPLLKSAEAVYGSDRYETAAKTARRYFTKNSPMVVVSGTSFADAVVAGPWAAAHKGGILFTRANQVPQFIKDLMNDYKLSVVGGTGVVPDSILVQLKCEPLD